MLTCTGDIINGSCVEVEARYSGQTGGNWYIRGREHIYGYMRATFCGSTTGNTMEEKGGQSFKCR